MSAPKGRFWRIVAELRAERPDIEYRQILRLAALVIEAHRKPEVLDLEPPAPRPNYFTLPVDIALQQSEGFGVMAFERRQGMSFSDEHPDDHFQTEAKLRNLIGRVSWPRTEMD